MKIGEEESEDVVSLQADSLVWFTEVSMSCLHAITNLSVGVFRAFVFKRSRCVFYLFKQLHCTLVCLL